MQDYSTPEAPLQPASDQKGLAIASFVIGILNLCGWLLPICGVPLGIIAVILGVLGLKSSQRTLAIVGLVLGGLTILLAIINAIAGVLLGPQMQDIFNNLNF